MKKILLAITLLLALAFQNNANAQFSLSINIGAQPSWGPVGYDHVEYYYMPDIQCYYYVPGHQFIYLNGTHWIFSNSLPPRYRGYDLYHSQKVVLNEPQAYLHYREHRTAYSNFRGHPTNQEFIRDSHDERYRDHWHDQHEADEEWRHRKNNDNRHDADRRDHH